MPTAQCFHLLSRSEILHANQASLFLGSAAVPGSGRYGVDLSLCVAAAHSTCLVLHLHQLLVGHPVHVGVVRICLGTCIIFGLFDCSLKQSLFFSLCLVGTSSMLHGHHDHPSLIHALFVLAHVQCHLHLRHHLNLLLSVVASPVAILIVPIPSRASAHGHCPRRSEVIISLHVLVAGCWLIILLCCGTFLISIVRSRFSVLKLLLEHYDLAFEVVVVFAKFSSFTPIVSHTFVFHIKLIFQSFDVSLGHFEFFQEHLRCS